MEGGAGAGCTDENVDYERWVFAGYIVAAAAAGRESLAAHAIEPGVYIGSPVIIFDAFSLSSISLTPSRPIVFDFIAGYPDAIREDRCASAALIPR